MKVIGCAISWLVAMLLTCCGAGIPDAKARGTVEGVSVEQVLSSVGVVLAAEGYSADESDASAGMLRTGWKQRGRRMIRYEVTIGPAQSGDGPDRPKELDISVTAVVRERVLEGWSEEYAARMESTAILEEIVERISLRLEAATYRTRSPLREARDADAKAMDGVTLPPAGRESEDGEMDAAAGDPGAGPDSGVPGVES